MDNVLQGIIKSEEEALRIEEIAKKQALEILAEARKKAEVILEKSLSEGETMAEDLLKKARAEVAKERDLNKSNKDVAEGHIMDNIPDKLNAASDYIVGKVVNKSWQ